MTRTRATILCSTLALWLLNCGALGAPARGDRDLPSSLFGGYAAVAVEASPTGSAALLSADDGMVSEPSVIVHSDGRRWLYATHRTGAGAVRIVRAVERGANFLRFEQGLPVLEATQAWEQGAVQSPSVLRDGANLWLFYEAGGAIGAARSTDGVSFERQSEPVLRADSAHGEAMTVGAPCVIARPSGGFLLAYASGGALFLARATQLAGPWTREGAGPIATPMALSEGGLESLSDPALVIERTAAGRAVITMAATTSGGASVPTTVGFAAFDDGVSPVFSRAERPLYTERTTPVMAGSFDRVDARTMLLWVTRSDRTRTVIGALMTPGGQRAGNPFVP